MRYEFVTDKEPPWLSTKGAPQAFVEGDRQGIAPTSFTSTA